MGLNLEWTQHRMGLNLEWTQPRMGLNLEWDSTPTKWDGTQPRMDFLTPKWDGSTQNGLKIIMLSCTGFVFIFSTITRGLQFWYRLFTVALYIVSWIQQCDIWILNIWMGLNIERNLTVYYVHLDTLYTIFEGLRGKCRGWVPFLCSVLSRGLSLSRGWVPGPRTQPRRRLNPDLFLCTPPPDTLYTIFEGLRGKCQGWNRLMYTLIVNTFFWYTPLYTIRGW